MAGRVSILAAAVTAAAAVGLAAAPAGAAYGDNFVQTEATAGRPVAEASHVMVVANSTDTVENGNLAEAYAHDCTGCRAVAVAFQVVLVPGSPRTVRPGNLASAANVRCTRCTAIAVAKQTLVYSYGATSIDRDAQAEVARIAAEVHQVTTSGVDPLTMEQRLQPLFDRLVTVVRDGLRDSRAGERSERQRAA